MALVEISETLIENKENTEKPAFPKNYFFQRNIYLWACLL